MLTSKLKNENDKVGSLLDTKISLKTPKDAVGKWTNEFYKLVSNEASLELKLIIIHYRHHPMSKRIRIIYKYHKKPCLGHSDSTNPYNILTKQCSFWAGIFHHA